MTQATQMAQTTAKGSIHLLWGLLASTIISAVGTIFIARLLGPENYGLYTIAISAPILFSNFRDWGITTAIIKFSAQNNTQNQSGKIRGILLSSTIFEIVIGLILTLLAFILSGFLGNSFQSSRNNTFNPNNLYHNIDWCLNQHWNCCLHWSGKNASK